MTPIQTDIIDAQTGKSPSTATGFVSGDSGLTPEQIATMLAAAGRHKNNQEYIESGREQVAEYRRQLQEEYERELEEKGSK